MLRPAPTSGERKLRTARRVFAAIPIAVFLLMLVLLAPTVEQSAILFVQMILRALVVSLAAGLICVAAYGFFRYLQDRSSGL